MTPADWAGLAVAICTLLAAFATGTRWLVKHYLSELRPNGGNSLKDKVNSLEEKVEFLTEIVLQTLKK
jgi:hypothetical protein